MSVCRSKAEATNSKIALTNLREKDGSETLPDLGSLKHHCLRMLLIKQDIGFLPLKLHVKLYYYYKSK